jgi:NodT family efflux transporter outer membrane factor (OMF) lipoprotein
MSAACGAAVRLLAQSRAKQTCFTGCRQLSLVHGHRQQAKFGGQDWRTTFSDPRLQGLIGLALANNRDLRIAMLNVEAVQAQYGIQRAAEFPAIDATGGRSRQRTVSDGASTVSSLNSLGVGVSAFEIDLFGRARSLSDAAFFRYLASEQGQKTAEITLIASVADAYFGELLAQEQLQLAQQTLEDWQQSLKLARILNVAKQSSGLDLAQAEGQVATAQADLEGRMRGLAQAHNALQLLLGTAIPADLPPAPALEDLPRPVLSAGLSSELLTRRPDILQAEHNLRAANADIGAARAAFFPDCR